MAEMFFGVLSLSVGFFLALWGWQYSRRPAMLKPGSLPYRVLIPWQRRRDVEKGTNTLSDMGIKIQAVRSLIVGILLEVAGIIELILGILKILHPDL